MHAFPTPPHPVRVLYQHLLAAYGAQQWWPSRSRFETIVGAYLVQNTSWRGVVRSIANLEKHGALSVEGMRALAIEPLRALIRPSGYMVRKAAALQAFVAFLDARYGGSLDRMRTQETSRLREELLALPGVGDETADVILLYALDHPVMVVDEYLRRILLRHELVPAPGRTPAGSTPAATRKPGYAALQQVALAAFADDPAPTLVRHFNEFHALIVEVGKNHCGPRPRCAECPLQSLLPLPSVSVTPTGTMEQVA